MEETKDLFRNIIIGYLKRNVNSNFTAKDIAEWYADEYPNEVQNKINSSKEGYIKNKHDCILQLVRQIYGLIDFYNKKAKKCERIYISADRPKKFAYLSQDSNNEDEENSKQHNQKEKELYIQLAKFCKSINIQTLRIDEKTSKKDKGKNHNIWLHPDVVGFRDLTEGFDDAAKYCLIEYSDERSCLYSFEVKAGLIRPHQLREYVFQTVSNSSWANYSYLVAEGISDDDLEELQLLCSSFNIGFIQLNKDNPTESKIEIRAPKTDLDWQMINRIAKENSDFKKFLNNITLTYQRHSNSNIAKPNWDIEEE